MKLSIVIPCYNEEGNIPLIFEKARSILSQRENVEIIFINNGSTDKSADVFNREIEKNDLLNYRVVSIERNQGYGHGILKGLESCSGEVLSWTHSDMQTDPFDVLTAYELFTKQNRPCLVKGKRKNRNPLDAIFTWGMQIISFFALNSYLDDINAQPKVFSKKFFNDHIKDKAPLDFSLDLYTLYIAKKNGLHILDIPVFFKKRIHGEAKGGGSMKTKLKLIRRTFIYIIELRKSLKT